MKTKSYLAVVALMTFSPLMAFGQNALTLDETIEEAANFFSDRIPEGVTISVFNFSSDSRNLSEYIIDELTIALINTGIDIIDRNNINEVNREIYYSFTGAVDDSTAQAYGHDVGVQTVVLGSFTKASDNTYRLRIQAIDVQTKRVQAGRTFSVRQDNRLVTLLNIYEDYTTGERIGTGAANILFGLGSALNSDKKWWIGGTVELAGSLFLIGGILTSPEQYDKDNWHSGTNGERVYQDNLNYDYEMKMKSFLTTGGIVLIGAGIVTGFVIPFFHHKNASKNISFVDPSAWNIELVSAMDNATTGFKLSYKIRL
jgi:hypothetical protein